jgi:FAD/FMN-containing dehydrogenase
VLGARYALGDGTLARTGGRVVKNVAGYGLHRMLCGSRGALAVIVEASLKLEPAPPARCALVYGGEISRVMDDALWSAFARMEPAVLTVLGRSVAELHPVLAGSAPCVLVAGFEGEAAHVDRQCEHAKEILGTPRHRVSGASVAALWQQITDFEELQQARLTFTTAHRSPAAMTHVLGRGFGDRFVFHAASGRLHVFPAGAEGASVLRKLAAHEFAPIEIRGIDGDSDPSVMPLAVTTVRRALRDALDPGHRFALGDRWS